MTGSAFK